MKEFKSEATWTASEWGEEYPDRVTVRSPNGVRYDVDHEDQIERCISCAPADLKAYVRREVLRCRPTGENECRQRGGAIVSLAMEDGDVVAHYLGNPSVPWRLSRHARYGGDAQRLWAPVAIAARAWRDRQWQDVEGAEGYAVKTGPCCENFCQLRRPDGSVIPVSRELLRQGRSILQQDGYPDPVIRACCKLLGVEREELCPACKGTGKVEVENECRNSWTEDCAKCSGVKLAENQIRDPFGEVYELRWHNGEPQCRALPPYIGTWGSYQNPCADAIAWFRANCPHDRFVTDDGRVVEKLADAVEEYEWPEREACANVALRRPPDSFRGRRILVRFSDLGPGEAR